jgi:hypothetical protein
MYISIFTLSAGTDSSIEVENGLKNNLPSLNVLEVKFEN